jgi:hypothetical protein
MRQDWVYLSPVQWVFNELGFKRLDQDPLLDRTKVSIIEEIHF